LRNTFTAKEKDLNVKNAVEIRGVQYIVASGFTSNSMTDFILHNTIIYDSRF